MYIGHGWRSLRFRLPVLIAAGTGSVLVVLAVLGYLRVASHLEFEAAERMESVAAELQGPLETSVERTRNVVTLEAERPEVLALAQGDIGSAEVQAAEEAIRNFMSQTGLAALRSYQVSRRGQCVLSMRREGETGESALTRTDRCMEAPRIPEGEFWTLSPLGFGPGGLFADISFRIGDEGRETVGTLRVDQDAKDQVARLSGLIADDAAFLIGTPGERDSRRPRRSRAHPGSSGSSALWTASSARPPTCGVNWSWAFSPL